MGQIPGQNRTTMNHQKGRCDDASLETWVLEKQIRPVSLKASEFVMQECEINLVNFRAACDLMLYHYK